MSEKTAVKSSTGRTVLLLGVLLAAGGAGVWWAQKGLSSPQGGMGPGGQSVPVALAEVTKGDIDVLNPALGTVTPLANVTVRTQISGQLQEVAFQEGQMVVRGDYLAQIDPRPYQMTLEQAQGALQKDQALLKDAQTLFARYQKLAAQDSISKQQLDTQAALVEQYQGSVLTDQGQIDASKLNLTYCHITAPISGRVGLRQIDAGNYAQVSDTNGLVTITQLSPISVLFSLPEDRLPAVMKRLSAGAELVVYAYDRAGSTKLAEGKLVAVDNAIDTSTGTVKLRAQFENADTALFPNQFVNVQIKVDTVHDAVIVPSVGILRGANGNFVYVAKDDHTVTMRPVKTGTSQGDKIEVSEGLAEGEKIVIDGTDKLRDGSKYRLPGEKITAENSSAKGGPGGPPPP